ncbi:type I polyketide synthase [Sesbania bispinosa]|nr:type I polyketide synthase [Sesbania bispinosa]
MLRTIFTFQSDFLNLRYWYLVRDERVGFAVLEALTSMDGWVFSLLAYWRAIWTLEMLAVAEMFSFFFVQNNVDDWLGVFSVSYMEGDLDFGDARSLLAVAEMFFVFLFKM